MDNRRIKEQDIIDKYTLHQQNFYKSFAKDYLSFLGNPKPNPKQLSEMQSVLSHVWIRQSICLDIRLTEKEKQCLYFSAKGKGLKETARLMNVSTRRVEQYRESIFRKLGCKNIIEAVIVGIRYGKISPPNEEQQLDDWHPVGE